MAEEIDLSPAEEAALERAWAKVGPLLAPGRTDAPFAADGPDLSGLGDLLNLSRQEVLDALFDAAIDSFDLALPDAAFGAPDQPREPAGSPEGGRWASGGGDLPFPPPYKARIADVADSVLAAARRNLARAGADPFRLGKARSDAAEALERAVKNRAGSLLREFREWFGDAEMRGLPEYRRLNEAGKRLASDAWVLGYRLGTGEEPALRAAFAESLPNFSAKVLTLTQAVRAAGFSGAADAPFYSPDQPRVPAGQPGGGRWAGGVSPGTAAARDAASDAVRAFAAGQGPPTAAEAEALAGHLAKLTVAQIHALKAEHGLKGSAPNKAALVAKLTERFRAHRERNFPESVSTGVDKGDVARDNTPVGRTTPTGVQAVTATTKEPHEMTATEFHGQPVSRERAVRTTSVYRGVNRDEGTRRTPGVTRTVADARKYLDDVLWPVPKPWHTPPAGAVPAASERYLTPAPMPDVSAAGVRAAADAAIAAHTAGASLMVPERADEPKRPASVLALYPNGSLKRVMPHPDPGSNEMRGQVQEWDAVPEAVVARVRVLAHYHAVEAALAAGKPVRPEVLADYPDLAERYHA